MAKYLSMGKKFFKDGDDDGGIIGMLKYFDRDGDGQITENGYS